MYLVSVPISVPVSKKKHFYLNLNQYRNAHFHVLSKAKNVFHDIVKPKLRHLPKFERVCLTYTLFTRTEQLCDIANICCIVDKFFSDTLVSCGVIEDDNRKIVFSVVHNWGGVDKLDPRVEVSIAPVEKSSGTPAIQHNSEERKMQISYTQVEIEEAIEKLVREQVIVREDQEVKIKLMATRGPEGYQAIIHVVTAGEAPATGKKAATKKVATKAPAKAAAAPAAEPAVAQAAEPAPVAEASDEVVGTTSEVEADTGPIEVVETDDKTVEVAEVVPTVEEEAPPAPRKSLFNNLQPPVNA